MLVNDGLSWLISFGVQFFFWRELNYYDDRVGYYMISGYVNGKVVNLLFSELKYYVQIEIFDNLIFNMMVVSKVMLIEINVMDWYEILCFQFLFRLGLVV